MKKDDFAKGFRSWLIKRSIKRTPKSFSFRALLNGSPVRREEETSDSVDEDPNKP